ncbi:MAG: hypothetical protein O3B13_06985, partial [Planctomycetota bacterium]|nr:hypothetical protein [Planctomycetota bacterium]
RAGLRTGGSCCCRGRCQQNEPGRKNSRKTREDRYADAGEIRPDATSHDDDDLANDLVTEQETRQNADRGWLVAEGAVAWAK